MHVRTPSVGTLGGLQTAPDVVKGPRREWRKPKPMMNGLKKSDEAIRPVRAANKGARASAESPEERASTKGNSEKHAPNSVSGKRATGGGPDTESCGERPEGTSHRALPPHHDALHFCGVAGGKGLNQGEFGLPKHAPNSVSGKRATGGGPDTESCGERPEGTSHRALPPHHAGCAAPGVPRTKAGRCGGCRRHHVGYVWRRSG